MGLRIRRRMARPGQGLKIRRRRADDWGEVLVTTHGISVWQRVWVAAALLGIALTWSVPSTWHWLGR